MNLKPIGYISIVLSVAACCIFVSSLYFLTPSTFNNNTSLRLIYQNLCCLSILGSLVLGISLILFSNLTEKARSEREYRLTQEEQARKADEVKQREDEIINKWINKKPD
jgi:hypothetical protein